MIIGPRHISQPQTQIRSLLRIQCFLDLLPLYQSRVPKTITIKITLCCDWNLSNLLKDVLYLSKPIAKIATIKCHLSKNRLMYSCTVSHIALNCKLLNFSCSGLFFGLFFNTWVAATMRSRHIATASIYPMMEIQFLSHKSPWDLWWTLKSWATMCEVVWNAYEFARIQKTYSPIIFWRWSPAKSAMVAIWVEIPMPFEDGSNHFISNPCTSFKSLSLTSSSS